MQIEDLMTRNVTSIRPQDTIERTAQLMNECNVGSLPVCEGHKVIGIVTDRDIVLRCIAAGKNVQQAVSEVMTPNPVTAGPQMDVHEAMKIMSQRKVRRLPVVENNVLIGMIALGDLAVEDKMVDNAGQALGGISNPASPYVQ